MYSKASWGGSVDPFVLTTFPKVENSDTVVTFVIYEWKDEDLLGFWEGNTVCTISLNME